METEVITNNQKLRGETEKRADSRSRTGNREEVMVGTQEDSTKCQNNNMIGSTDWPIQSSRQTI